MLNIKLAGNQYEFLKRGATDKKGLVTRIFRELIVCWGIVSIFIIMSCGARTQLHRYTLTVSTQGEGKVVSDPSGIDCGEDCNEDYKKGTQVTLTVSTTACGWKFDGWGGDCQEFGTNDQAVLIIDRDKECLAKFSQEPPSITHVGRWGAGSLGC